MPEHGEVGNGLFAKRFLEFGHHAPTGHRIPAQGANSGNAPEKETRVLKERRIGAGLLLVAQLSF